MIIQIEQARTNPSVGTTVKLADALGVSITTLLDHEQGSPVRLVPESQAVRMWSTDAGSSTTLHVGTEARGPLELWTWRLMPGDSSASDPHPEGTVELLHVTAGELTLVVDGTPYAVPAAAPPRSTRITRTPTATTAPSRPRSPWRSPSHPYGENPVRTVRRPAEGPGSATGRC